MTWSEDMELYIQAWEGGKNNVALSENHSNEEPKTGAVTIQIMLALGTCPSRAYRIYDETAMASYWTH